MYDTPELFRIIHMTLIRVTPNTLQTCTMYILNMVIILNVLYNNVVTAIRYIRTYYVSTGYSPALSSLGRHTKHPIQWSSHVTITPRRTLTQQL
jgi:hypothetical protein